MAKRRKPTLNKGERFAIFTVVCFQEITQDPFFKKNRKQYWHAVTCSVCGNALRMSHEQLFAAQKNETIYCRLCPGDLKQQKKREAKAIRDGIRQDERATKEENDALWNQVLSSKNMSIERGHVQ